jgi:sterol desaturase/sphingolipid hydroxylase (fatty acid hydroxylase superfamily)
MSSVIEQWLIIFSIPLYAIIILTEIVVSNWHKKDTYTLKNTFSNFYLMLLNSGIDLLFRGVYFAILTYCYHHRLVSIPLGFWYWFILVLAEDFIYYWLHRFDHVIRFFWATHITHHSSQKMNFTVGFRSSVFQPLYRFVYFLPLALLGFKAIDIALVYSATQIWGIFVHTEYFKNMGWLEYILVTPSHHRVHHGSNIKYLDKNMGMFLIIWDKLFGTFQKELNEENYEPIKYGLTKNLEKPNAINLVFDEWKNILLDLKIKNTNLKQKLLYIFGPPGYSHNNSRQTTKQLQKIEEGNYNKSLV